MIRGGHADGTEVDVHSSGQEGCGDGSVDQAQDGRGDLLVGGYFRDDVCPLAGTGAGRMEAALMDKNTHDSREDMLAQLLAEAERTVGSLALKNDLLEKHHGG